MAADKTSDGVDLAHAFAQTMQRAGVSGPDGCATLALAYGIWLDACDEASIELCDVMLDMGKQTAREAFTRLRRLRAMKQQLTDEALASTH
jgi:hypothetical protein